MDEFDLKVAEALSVLAAIVNRAGPSEATSADAVQVAKVPLALLLKAKGALLWFSDCEFGTKEIGLACQRALTKEKENEMRRKTHPKISVADVVMLLRRLEALCLRVAMLEDDGLPVQHKSAIYDAQQLRKQLTEGR